MKARQWKSATQPASQSNRLLGWASGHVTLMLGLLIGAGVLFFFGREILRPAVIIEVVAVPKVMKEAGLDADVITRLVLDRIDDIESTNFELGTLNVAKSFRDRKELELPAYEIPGFHVSTRDLIKVLRRSLGREPTTVDISVSQTDERKFQLQVRVHPADGKGLTLPSEPALDKYENLAEHIASSVLRQLDPAQLANMLYITKGSGHIEVLQSCVDRLERDKKVQCLVAWGDIEADGQHYIRAQNRYQEARGWQWAAPDALAGLGYIAQSSGDLAGARKLYEEARQAGLAPQLVHYYEALLRKEDGELGRAVRELQQAIAIGKPNAGLLMVLARMQHEHDKKSKEWNKTILKAVEADPQRAATMGIWAHMLASDDRFGESLEKIEAAERLMQTESAHRANVDVAIGLALDMMGKRKKAIEILKRAAGLAPDSSYVLEAIAGVMAKTNEAGKDEVIELVRRATKMDPEDWSAHSRLGLLLEQKNRQQDAMSCWEKVIALNPHAIDTRMRLVDALLRNGDQAGAERQLRAALQLAPKWFDGYFALGSLLSDQLRYSDAVLLYRQAIEHLPDDLRLRFKLFASLQALKKDADAAVVLAAVERMDQGQARHSLAWGEFYYAQKQFPAAEKKFRAAVEYNPQSGDAHLAWGYTLFELGDYAAAKTELDKAIRLRPDFSAAIRFRDEQMKVMEQAVKPMAPPDKAVPKTARAAMPDIQ
jgi:tetratricopeptide (TPR) repeat protein